MAARSTLRRLARQHAQGRLSTEEYRTQRRAFINAVIDGIVKTDVEPTLLRLRIASREPRAIWVVATILVVLMLTVAILHTPASPTHSPSSNPPASLTPGAIALKDSGQKRAPNRRRSVELRLESFVTGDWSESNIETFQRQWDALTPNERAKLKVSPQFIALEVALEHVLKESTQDPASHPQSTSRVSRLQSLANHLGLALPGAPGEHSY